MGFRETTVTKERIAAEKHTETDRPKVSETDVPNLSHNTDFKVISSSEVIDSLVNIFKKQGLMDDTAVEKSESKQTDISNKNDYSQSLEKREDGKYYDKETGKEYDSIDAWKKAQITLAKYYEGYADFCEQKAKREYAYYKNSEANGKTSAEKQVHFLQSQKFYKKEENFREEADKICKRLGEDLFSEKRESDLVETKERRDVKRNREAYDHRNYTGGKLLEQAQYYSEFLAQNAYNPENANRVKELCKRITENCDRDDEEDEIELDGGLLPKYQKLMDNFEYETVNEMCNDLSLNYDDVYDDEWTTYGEEYRRGFCDCINNTTTFSMLDTEIFESDEYTEPYKEGLSDADELRCLVDLDSL